MQSNYDDHHELETILSRMTEFSELKIFLEAHPKKREALFNLIIQKKYFMKLISDTHCLKSLLSYFPNHKREIFELSCCQDIFKQLCTKMKDLHHIAIILFPEYKAELLPLACRQDNFKRLVQTKSDYSHLRAIFYSVGYYFFLNHDFSKDDFNLEQIIAKIEYAQKRARSKIQENIFIPQEEQTKEAELKFTPFTLQDYLRTTHLAVEELIITIGSADITDRVNNDNSWQQNLTFDVNNTRLILNVDYAFNDALISGAIDTQHKKYIDQTFDKALAKTLSPLIHALLDQNITIIIADYSEIELNSNVLSIIHDNLAYYRGPDDTKGNLIYLKGYCEFHPLFWPTKAYLEHACQASDLPSAYYKAYRILAKFNKPEHIPNVFKDIVIQDIHTFIKRAQSPSFFSRLSSFFESKQHNGVLFYYPHIGEISRVSSMHPQHSIRIKK